MPQPVFRLALVGLPEETKGCIHAAAGMYPKEQIEVVDGPPDSADVWKACSCVLADTRVVQQVRQEIPQKTWLIAVQSAGSPAPQVYDGIRDVWVCPDETALRFHFERLFETYSDHCRAVLTRIYLDTFIDSQPEMIWFKDLDGIHVKVNSYFCKIVGKDRSNVEGYGHAHIWGMSEEEYETTDLACKKSDERVLTTGNDDSSLEYVSMDGRVRTLLTLKSAVRDDDGRIIGTAGRARDITDMRSILAKVDLLLDNIPLAVLLTDEDGHIIKANDHFREIFLQHLDGLVLGKTAYEEFIRQVSELEKVLPGDMHSSEEFNTRQFHEERKILSGSSETIVDILRKDILDHQNSLLGSVIIFRDITSERNMTTSLQKSAFLDPLTGLQNRRGFYTRIANKPEPGDVIVYLDVDKFKQLNDVWGHDSGDRALEMVAHLLRKICTSAARLGGDEFIMYFSRISLQTVLNKLVLLAQDMKRGMQGRFKNLTLSIGVAVVAEDETVDEVVRKADAAMYMNKRHRAEYEHLQEALAVLRTEAETSEEQLKTLGLQIESCEKGLSPYTLYKPGMQSASEGVTRQSSR